ncbi:hypothetical protein ABZ319_29005 [Nocardia sp. NPDC005978]|uniref:hypothetical protein n=1 Tax=Nocardia sp. NPDC005978 TaxID=3156725 RepID=UPI0033A16A81
MTYPPGPPSGSGGDPNAQGQQPDPAWWDRPAAPPPADPTQVNWAAQQQPPNPNSGWQQPQQPDPNSGWQQPQQPDPNSGWQQPQQQWGGQPAYGQQPGYGQPPPTPPRSNTGLIIGVVLGVVAVLAVAIGAVVVFTKDDGEQNQAVTTSTTTEESTTSEAPTTTKSTTTTKAAPSGGKFSYTEYGQDWNFRLGDVALQASWVEGKDYSSCGPIEEGGKLTGLGCQYAAELVWKSENGGLMLTQFVLGMGDATAASGAEGQFDDNDLNLRSGSYIANWHTGKWRDGSEGQFLVITFATADASVAVDTVEKYLRYRHSDTLGALLWR